ncbi:hypothetical protein BJX76DRAFT_358038 [Aspergillus varians]
MSFVNFKVPILEKRGLVNFRLMSDTNGICLCPTCHAKFDDQRDPKLSFYPSDIQFFIRFELRDKERRQQDGSKRTVPTAEQYIRWCGLYNRVFFSLGGEDMVVVKEPAVWGGAPLAVLRRAFGIMGCPRASGIPKQDRDDLRLLWDLYFGDDEELATTAVEQYRSNATDKNFGIDPEFDEYKQDGSEDGQGDSGTARGGDDVPETANIDFEAVDEEVEWDDTEDEMPPHKKRALAGTWKRANFDFHQWKWEFGPNSSSNDKARELPPLLGPTSFDQARHG